MDCVIICGTAFEQGDGCASSACVWNYVEAYRLDGVENASDGPRSTGVFVGGQRLARVVTCYDRLYVLRMLVSTFVRIVS